jgi:Ca2+-binding EF-hand superfamily protein
VETSKDLFVKLDRNADGQIDFNEFVTLMRDEDGRPTWLTKAAAVTEREINPF